MTNDIYEVKLYSCWRPTTGMTGCGVVLRIDEETPRWGKLYHFVTDFGNVCILTFDELFNNYQCIGIEENIKDRYARQQELLKEIYEEYLLEV